jgi:hypothetical protein
MIITNNNITEATLTSYDPDAQAFFTAAGIDDTIQQIAVNSLVVSLKVHDIWDDLYAIYPFVGGNAISHKYNLKNPANTDAAYRLTFTNGPVHSVSGVRFNGSDQYADTHLVPDSVFGNYGDYSMGYYTMDLPPDTVGWNMAATDNPYAQSTGLIWADDLAIFDSWGEDMRIVSTSDNSSMKGFIWVNYATASTPQQAFYVNDVAIVTGNNPSTRTGGVLESIYIGALNNDGTATQFAKVNSQLAFIGANLASKASDFNLIVQTFMNNLNRNV